MVFHHNTIVSVGNTNGLALQGSNYSNVTVTNNYFSGFGYTVSVGHAPSNSSMVFTDNVWGTDLQQEYGPLYGWWPGPGSQWRRNKVDYVNAIHMRGDNPGSHLITAADDGKYWWPDDTLSNSDYTGL
jgi:hypothetical protein